jgi:hypothetical protein
MTVLKYWDGSNWLPIVSGLQGVTGTSIQGTSGTAGAQGTAGSQGTAGTDGTSAENALYYHIPTNLTLTNPTAGVSFSPLGLTNGNVSLDANKTYYFDMLIYMQISSGSTRTLNMEMVTTGTAPTTIGYQVASYASAQAFGTTTAQTIANVITNATITGSLMAIDISRSAASLYRTIRASGTIRTGNGACTVAPLFRYPTGTETSIIVQAGSYALFEPLIGTSSNGTWS